MTARKRWPNEADWARLDSIVLAERIESLASPISDSVGMTEIERVQRASKISQLALKIINKLQAVGPQAMNDRSKA